MKTMKKFAALRSKTYSYLTDDSAENKKAKGTKMYHETKFLNLKIIGLKQINLKKK